MQYQRRENIEIHNVPQSIDDKNLEKYCCDVLSTIGNPVQPNQIHACHRMKNKSKTIIRFVNRKDADKSLYARKKLKEINKEQFKLPADSPGLFINENLCRPMEFLYYKVRTNAKSLGKGQDGKNILTYNLWKGRLTITLRGTEFTISHIDHLIDLELASEDDRMLLFN